MSWSEAWVQEYSGGEEERNEDGKAEQSRETAGDKKNAPPKISREGDDYVLEDALIAAGKRRVNEWLALIGQTRPSQASSTTRIHWRTEIDPRTKLVYGQRAAFRSILFSLLPLFHHLHLHLLPSSPPHPSPSVSPTMAGCKLPAVSSISPICPTSLLARSARAACSTKKHG